MRSNLLVTVGAIAVLGLSGAIVAGQQRQGGGGAPARVVPKLPTDKTMFWTAADIQARWKENEALKRINSRLFDGPTNISANVRIVAPDDPPLTHDTTADLWIVTEGTATARTDGTLAGARGAQSISTPTERPLRAGDVLYVPPGVPHHFTDAKGFRAWLVRFDTLGLVRTKPAAPAETPAPAGRGAADGAAAPVAGRGRGGAPAAQVPQLATDKTMFWTAADIEGRWKENEANKRPNSRIYNGPANISANVRIVMPDDPPLAHQDTADLWIVTAGEAVARTDGELVTQDKTSTLRNATVRPMHVGDVLYVPPSVAHHFTDVKGFRAWLIRFDVEGWAQSIPPPAPAAGR